MAESIATVERRISKMVVKVEDEVQNIKSAFDKIISVDEEKRLNPDYDRVTEKTAYVFQSKETLGRWLLSRTEEDRALIAAIYYIAEPPKPIRAVMTKSRQEHRKSTEINMFSSMDKGFEINLLLSKMQAKINVLYNDELQQD